MIKNKNVIVRNRYLRSIFYLVSFIVFSGLLVLFVIPFYYSLIGFVVINFIVFSSLLVFVILYSLLSFVRTLMRVPTLEDRVRVLEDALYDETKK